MKVDELLDVSERAEVRFLREAGWQVSFSKGLWDRYVRVPEWVDDESEYTRLGDIFAYVRGYLSTSDRCERCGNEPRGGIWLKMEAYPNDPKAVTPDGQAIAAAIELAVFATIDRDDHSPRLVVVLARETLPARTRVNEFLRRAKELLN